MNLISAIRSAILLSALVSPSVALAQKYFPHLTSSGANVSPQSPKFSFGSAVNPEGETIEVDADGFIFNGTHVIPVMGEMHFSRVPEVDWRREIRKMKAGGITILATYIFWNHHEAEEGRWNWSGNKNLHRFLEVCKDERMPVVLRVGPFCHGEVYQGGFPVWLAEKAKADPANFKIRTLAPGFIAATQRLYSNIFAQTSDMLWKHGGPVVGVQIENECRGPWNYYMTLKDMALSIGFDVPFYTRTGWPKLNGKEEFGKLLPLYGDYADGFWDRALTDMPGAYAEAFKMKQDRISGSIATETFGTNQDTKMDAKELTYPYLTCELGGGMMPSYHRRINISGKEALPLAICKVGSGSNLPGYYMYHGGSNDYNPDHTMAECQASPLTNYNDLPHMTYDFQAPLGEMGQLNTVSFHQTRWLHQMLADWGDQLAVAKVNTESLKPNLSSRGSFKFVNTYVRILNEDGQSHVEADQIMFHGCAISSLCQPFCMTNNHLYFVALDNVPPVVFVDGKKYKMKLDKKLDFNGFSITVLSPAMATLAYKIDGDVHFATAQDMPNVIPGSVVMYKDGNNIVEDYWTRTPTTGTIRVAEQQRAAAPRAVAMGSQRVAEQPSDADFDNAAIWTLDVKAEAIANVSDAFLEINYKGDVARLYVDGKLVQDNFWNGKPMLVRMADLKGSNVELRILPLGKDYPIYLQKEQKALLDAAPASGLLSLDGVNILTRCIK